MYQSRFTISKEGWLGQPKYITLKPQISRVKHQIDVVLVLALNIHLEDCRQRFMLEYLFIEIVAMTWIGD